MSTENHFRQRLTYFYCVNVALLALGLFLHGFFPNNNIKGSFSSVTDLPLNLGNHWLNADEYCKRKVDKLVIMVIDAIRYDFIYEDGNINMPYTMSAIDNDKACLFKLRANAPTVTMPRIKAITSGSVSNFFDILMNFGSSEMLDDNIIDQAKHNDYKIVFYGDDTWLRLFPWRFHREEGTSSFYVSDYTEVDNNVTRNVNFELERNDWDIMILHYLGLDHIGHLDGPKSKLVKPKLNEMDDIIRKLHTYLLNEELNGKKTLLFVLGDHGMADLGGHGGTSMPEIIIPLISFGLGCGGIYKSEIGQVDLASTLSILLGIPIPANNVGHVILPLLTSSSSLSTADILYALYYNAYQVITQFLQNGGTILDEGYNEYWGAQLKHIDWLESSAKNECDTSNIERLGPKRRKRMPEPFYKEIINKYDYALRLMSSHLLKSVGDFHLTEMIIAMFILAQLFFIALFGTTFEVPSMRRVRIVSTVVCCVSMFCCWMNFIDLHCCLSSFYSIAVTLIVIFIITLNFLLISNCKVSVIFTSIMQLKPDNLISFALLAGTILQTISLSGTSLIENEDKVWYHLLLFVLMVTIAYSIFNNCECSSPVSLSLIEFDNFINLYRTTVKYLLLLVAYRILKNYQECHYYYSTVKWLPNKEYLSFITIFGLLSVWWALRNIMSGLSKRRKNCSTLFENLLISICLITVYYYRGVTGQLILPFMGNIQSRGVIEVKLFFVSFTGLIVVKIYKLRKYSALFNDSKQIGLFPQYLVTSMVEVVLICWILLCTLLARPHNVWLSCALILTCKFFNERLNNIVYLTVVYYWIGILFYFFQGNTNYINSIDITAGYVGQSDYNAVIAGLFIGINAFSFPVISYFLLLFASFQRDWTNLSVIYKVRSLLLVMHLFFYLLITTLHRYHLFIWSVFSPKLLYLSVNSVFIVVLYWVTEGILLLSYYLRRISSSSITKI